MLAVLKKKKFQTIFIALSFGFAIFGLNLLGLFDYAENATYDMRVRDLLSFTEASDDIILVVVDQGSIDWANSTQGWGWPFPRKAYGDLLDFLAVGNAASCSFDIIFSEPSVYNSLSFNDDASFAKSGQNFGRAIHTVFFNNQTGGVNFWKQNIAEPRFSVKNIDVIPDSMKSFLSLGNDSSINGVENGEVNTEEDTFFSVEKISDSNLSAVFPLDDIANSSFTLGSVTGKADFDGVFRRQFLFNIFDGKLIPGLSVAALVASGWSEEMTYNSAKSAFNWQDVEIPVDSEGRVLLKFKGDLNVYYPYAISDILQSKYLLDEKPYEEMTEEEQSQVVFFPEDFEGRHVFVGYYGPGLYDVCNSPIESVYPGVGMHLTLMDNILTNDFMHETGWVFNLLFFLILAFLATFIALYSKRIVFSILSVFVLVVLVVGIGIVGYISNLWIPIVAPLSVVLLSYASGMLLNFSTEGKQKRLIKSTFKQYLSPAVIEILLAHPENLKLGGERREITIFFSDIQGFTTISEKLDPEKLIELLNEYLSFMSGIIMESGGTIDKYEGDAIIAFWNAPTDQHDHPLRAIRAAMLCQQRLKENLAYFNEKFNANLFTRIGMNTGFAVVGNMGSKERFDYTMLGDSVNLTSRLEGLNKQFGTYFMCTKETLTKANVLASELGEPQVYARKLAIVAVVGKNEPVTVYEPFEESAFMQKKDILAKFDEGRDLFYAGEFSKAIKIFHEIQEEDSPSFFYALKCQEYIDNPPTDWHGFWRSTSK